MRDVSSHVKKLLIFVNNPPLENKIGVFFASWKTSSKMGLVSGKEAVVASALQVAGGWASNLLKMRPLPCEVVVSFHSKRCAWTAGEKDRGDFRAWCTLTSVPITL